MKKKLLKGLLFILLGYLLLVAVHFIYLELGGRDDGNGRYSMVRQYASNDAVQMELPVMTKSSSVRNYASVKFKVAQQEAAVEQKYEKIASVSATTEKYDEDQQRARDAIKTHNALIQEEAVNNYNRRNVLNLTIGVPPGEFDAIVADLKLIGKIQDFQITKTDKTNDFLELKAKRATLEKTRDSLIGLKAQGGKIEELVKLEQEVLSLEDKIQSFGVQLGQFDKVNEFCTVRFTLAETKAEIVRSPHLGYLIESLHWASTVYLAWLGIACVGLIAVILLLIIIEKSKIFHPET
jgi:hypothetical protein